MADSLPRKCVSCAHWGAQPSPRNDDTGRWRWCNVKFPASAHVDYVCAGYERLHKDEAIRRLKSWGIAPESVSEEKTSVQNASHHPLLAVEREYSYLHRYRSGDWI